MNFRAATSGDFLWAGDSKVRILGYGDIDIEVKTPHQKQLLHLKDVAFCKDFASNLVSLRLLRRQGYWWDTRRDYLRKADGGIAAIVEDLYDQYVLEYLPPNFSKVAFFTRRNNFNSYTERRPLLSEPMKWHLRLGHAGPEALEHLVNYSRGARIKGRVSVKGIPTYKCDGCGLGKARRRTRRSPRKFTEGLGERLALDFFDFEQDSEGIKVLLLVTDRWSGFVFDLYLKDKSALSIKAGLGYLLNLLKYQYKIDVKVIETDNEIVTVKPEVAQYLQERYIRIEPSAPDTQAQNGAAERSGGVVKDKIRAMGITSNLPKVMWVEIARAAVYLYNRTPRYYYSWKTAYERFYMFLALRDGVQASNLKPQQAHLRVYGCKAYAASSAYLRKKDRLS
jgi:hypothetical protein